MNIDKQPDRSKKTAAGHPVKSRFGAVQAKRTSSFFVPGNYTNVRGLCVFGY
jgi:hypothetical protein